MGLQLLHGLGDTFGGNLLLVVVLVVEVEQGKDLLLVRCLLLLREVNRVSILSRL